MRENDVININYYNSHIIGNTNSQWNNNSVEIAPALLEDSRGECNSLDQTNTCPIEVEYQSVNYGDQTECKHITVEVSEISFGKLWTPLYKSAGFTATANCSDVIKLLKPEGDKMTPREYQIDGHINISGHLTVNGFCSRRTAKILITNYVLQQIYRNATSYIHKTSI